MTAGERLQQPFGTLPDLVRAHAAERPERLAVIGLGSALTYRDFDEAIDRVAAALQRDGLKPGDVAAVCASASSAYATVFLGILRAGVTVSPLAPGSTAESLAGMVEDCAARILFLDREVAAALAPVADRLPALRVALDGSDAARPFETWMAEPGSPVAPVTVQPKGAFNIIYSSGTTGRPKGIVQPNSLRWAQFNRAAYTAETVSLVSTPLYSNTTLVSFLPTLANGGAVVLLPKFDAGEFLALAERHRVTHAMLVPVQYRRLMQHRDFDAYDLSSFVIKYSTSAPFPAELKAEVLRRWPGGLVEFYGMTEGGGSCALLAHEHPDKLSTVGKPMEGHDVRLIDEQGREVAAGEAGEVVGRSPAMMKGYHNQLDKTREAEWMSPEGLRFIRTGDVGRFDADGFLTLIDRRKDMIISGGFNIYPSDLEAELTAHPEVVEASVFGVASETWGETPVAAVVLKPGAELSAAELRVWVNGRVGKTQRLTELHLVDALPRSAIGKVLKRELREMFSA
ncbi:class I adenylate-forming enzyme family protein [Caulobacter sp. S45]|uniref:class I adenylate-forming enzyme family protein n=1 Tax=Caulobacter sp. S45 TaxID=1641861 RepID=UPI00157610C1|nr:class I adenylate-forming enzyme family protein [Caulobacter sp. S45]